MPKLSISINDEQYAYLKFLQELWEEDSLSAILQSMIDQHSFNSDYEFVPATFRKRENDGNS